MSSKIALLSDIHFGVKKSNEKFLFSQLNFFKKCFIPELKKQKIKEIYILGDLFDNRNSINLKIKNYVYDLFNEYLKDFNITIIVGNHDIYYTNTLEISSLKWLNKFDNITIIDTIQVKEVFNKKILMVPWITNYENFKKQIKKFNADICFGHFDIVGMKMNNKFRSENGLPINLYLDNFNITFSGHYHLRSEYSNQNSKIIYLGSPYHLNRNDIDTEKGFTILDLKTLSYKHINQNTSIKYININYGDMIEKDKIENNIIDLYVQSNIDEEQEVQDYIDRIEKYNPLELNVKIISNENYDIDMSNCGIKSREELIDEYVSNLKVENKNEILNIMKEIYSEIKSDL